MGLHKTNGTTTITPATAWLFPLVYIGISAIIMLSGEFGKEALRYDRVWIGQGETWRLISGHFAHLGWSHLALNSAGLLLVWFLVGGAYSLRVWISIAGVTFAAMGMAFWFLNPELYWYVGHVRLVARLAGRRHFRLACADMDAETLILVAARGRENCLGAVQSVRFRAPRQPLVAR